MFKWLKNLFDAMEESSLFTDAFVNGEHASYFDGGALGFDRAKSIEVDSSAKQKP